MREPYTKAEIDRLAQDTLNRYGNHSYPINPVIVANKLGLSVYGTHFERQDISGVIDPNAKEILIAAKDSKVRQRFSIAHEIGHYVLHYAMEGAKALPAQKKVHVSYRDSASSYGYDMLECEANHFAACLLMPKDKVKEVMSFMRNPKDVADFFFVSLMTASIRLNYLGYVNE